ncbi:MAG: methyltransferase [Alphaproteobacteria bacterium]|nr:methyltransferase [Alphaproteobacteria bacterium]
MTAPLDTAAAADRLDALGAWLVRWQDLWTVAPFREHHPAWTRAHADLAAWLTALPADRVRALEADPDLAVDAPAPWPTLVATRRDLVALGPLPAQVRPPGFDPAQRKVRGRKWTQVGAFLAAVEPVVRTVDGPVVEWCAGRGHLGRTLAAHLDRPAWLLERDPHLCAPPEGIAEHPDVAHRQVDVLDDAVFGLVPERAALVGLHACGRLTDRLFEAAWRRDAAMVAASPCCPHRLYGPDHHAPRSRRAAAHGLAPTLDLLRLAVLDEVVATPRRRTLRRREQWLRIAVDLLARQHTGHDVHHGFRTVDRNTFDLPLDRFVREVVVPLGVPVPDVFDADALGRAATVELARQRALGLVRMLFRRPLELWLALDRAVGLAERGWRVDVGTFCAREATPRNLLIVGRPG